jgi:hypothetical protein
LASSLRLVDHHRHVEAEGMPRQEGLRLPLSAVKSRLHRTGTDTGSKGACLKTIQWED